jgi:hypothetical protein
MDKHSLWNVKVEQACHMGGRLCVEESPRPWAGEYASDSSLAAGGAWLNCCEGWVKKAGVQQNTSICTGQEYGKEQEWERKQEWHRA